MLLAISKMSLSLLLFMLLFICLRSLALSMLRRRAALSRLSPEGKAKRFWPGRGWMPVRSHLKDLLDATRFIPSMKAYLTLTVFLVLSGALGGSLLFQSIRGVLAMTAICGILPYLLLRMKLISRQLRTRLEFLPAMEIFYQQVLLSTRPNMRNTLQAIVTGDRLLYPIKPTFEQLHRNLSAGRDIEDALRVFVMELGHVWAEYFVNMLRMAIQEGVDITPNLKELIEDMRRAQMYDQKSRNRLLEIRLASFSPALFLILFLGINLKLNYENSVRFYFMDSAGRNMLLNELLLMFGAFVMGIYLSMRRM